MLRTLAASGTASAAYLLMQRIDRRLLPNEYDDLLLWGGLLSRNPRRQQPLGLAVHLTLGATVALAYAVLRSRLPRWPGPLQGLLFLHLENVILYPGIPVLNAIHPDVRDGRLPSLATWRYFWVETLRHSAFGIVLGLLVGGKERAE